MGIVCAWQACYQFGKFHILSLFFINFTWPRKHTFTITTNLGNLVTSIQSLMFHDNFLPVVKPDLCKHISLAVAEYNRIFSRDNYYAWHPSYRITIRHKSLHKCHLFVDLTQKPFITRQVHGYWVWVENMDLGYFLIFLSLEQTF